MSRARCLGMMLALASVAGSARAETFVQPSPAEVRMTPAEISATVKGLADLMATGYFDSTRGLQAKRTLLAALAAKKYRPNTSPPQLVAQLARDVQSVIHDSHFNMLHFPPAAAGFNWVNAADGPMDEKVMLEGERQRLRSGNFGVMRAEILEGNIGYLNLSRFDAPLELFREPLANAFNLLQNTDALIVDVRKNPGGNPECVQLAFSYFLDGPSRRATSKHTRMYGKTEEYWTYSDPGGRKYVGKPVCVLTSGGTASGGEMFAYQMKNHGKGTLVGERTVGGAHSFDTFKIGPERIGNVMVLLPNAHLVDDVTGTDWEGTGVVPDIEVPADSALAIASSRLVSELMAAAASPEARQGYERLLEKLAFQSAHGPVLAGELESYAGRYGVRRVWVERGVLRFQRDNGPRVDLEAVGKHTFDLNVAMSPKPRVRFEVEAGVVKAMLWQAPQGEERAAREP